MPAKGFNIEGLDFELTDPKRIGNYDTWMEVRDLAVKSFSSSLPNRSRAEITHLLSSGTVDGFIASRQQPTKAARQSGHMRPSWFYSPTMAIAYDHNRPIGYAYAAHNVSGNPLQASAKRLLARSYINIRELAVHPEYQGNGIAEVLGHLSISQQGNGLLTTAYVFDESEGIGAALIGLGFDEYTDPETGYDKPEEVWAFGPDSEPALMRRFEARIHDVHLNIMSREGAGLAVAKAMYSAGLMTEDVV